MKYKAQKNLSAVNNTPFDDVFRTIAEKMPELMIPLINEVFKTNYSEMDLLHQGRNEFTSGSGKIITDSIYYFRDRTYHIECQSTNDRTMTIRMFEYDFFIALENPVRKRSCYEVCFPASTVLFLRKPKHARKELSVKVSLPVGKSFVYALPVIYAADYSLNEIFEKRLLMLLPFYLLRYEKEFNEIEEDEERFYGFLLEIREICGKLKVETGVSEKSDLRRDLMSLIRKIADHVLRNREKMKKGVVDVMGGKILELPSDKLKQAWAEGAAEGEARGHAAGIALMGQLATCLVQDGQADLISIVAADETKRQEYCKKYGLI